MVEVLNGTLPDGSNLVAVVDDSAHHVEGAVAARRFAAFCSPFLSRDAAESALVAAGCASIAKQSDKKGPDHGSKQKARA